MEIIPAIDIINGQCVRLTKGDYNAQTTYHSDPAEVAHQFEQAGIKRLHVVDLDGAKAQHVVNLDSLRAITNRTQLEVDFGGGVKTDKDMEQVLEAGAKQVTAGSIAVKNPTIVREWIKKYGPDCIILGADVLDGKVMVSGWTESSQMDLFPYLASYLNEGISHVICTDISKDGMMQGPSVDLYQSILSEFPAIKLIASGGVANIDDLYHLQDAGLYGAIVGKAYYEGAISLEQLSSF